MTAQLVQIELVAEARRLREQAREHKRREQFHRREARKSWRRLEQLCEEYGIRLIIEK